VPPDPDAGAGSAPCAVTGLASGQAHREDPTALGPVQRDLVSLVGQDRFGGIAEGTAPRPSVAAVVVVGAVPLTFGPGKLLWPAGWRWWGDITGDGRAAMPPGPHPTSGCLGQYGGESTQLAQVGAAHPLKECSAQAAVRLMVRRNLLQLSAGRRSKRGRFQNITS
jgi:hypothetical protein